MAGDLKVCGLQIGVENPEDAWDVEEVENHEVEIAGGGRFEWREEIW